MKGKIRWKMVLWGIIFIGFSGLLFYGCVGHPLQTGVQEFGLDKRHRSEPTKIHRSNSPVLFWSLTVVYCGLALIPLGIGVLQLASAHEKDVDFDEFLPKLKSMSVRKRQAHLRQFFLYRRLNTTDTVDEDQDARENQAISDLIAEDLRGKTPEEQQAYMSQIKPDEAMVRFFERFSRDTGKDNSGERTEH